MEWELRLGQLCLKLKISTPFLIVVISAIWYFTVLPLHHQQQVVEAWEDFRDDYLYRFAYDVHRKAGTAATGIFGVSVICWVFGSLKRLLQAAE